jgi:hypothetical protein
MESYPIHPTDADRWYSVLANGDTMRLDYNDERAVIAWEAHHAGSTIQIRKADLVDAILEVSFPMV